MIKNTSDKASKMPLDPLIISEKRAKKMKVYKGCFYMFMASMMFGIANIFIKKATTQIPVLEIVFFRALFSVLSMVLFMGYKRDFQILKTPQLKMQIIRGIIGFVSLYTYYLSFDYLPITDATALHFAAPLFVTIFAIPMLKEHVSLSRWVAVIIGFIGILVMSKPSGNLNIMGVGAALISALLEGIVMIMARQLSKGNKPFTSVFYHALMVTLVAGCWLPFVWQSMDLTLFLTMILVALLCNCGQLFTVSAYGLASAAVVAPFMYTLIIWGSLAGCLVWHETITAHLWIGLPLVIFAGLYIIYEETKDKVSHVQEIN